jgi:hypothetical protein
MASWKCLVALVALMAMLVPTMGQVNAVVADCEDKLDALVERYENSTLATATCDATCLESCYGILETAFDISTSANPAVSSCPAQASIIKCLNVSTSKCNQKVGQLATITP